MGAKKGSNCNINIRKDWLIRKAIVHQHRQSHTDKTKVLFIRLNPKSSLAF